MQLFAQTFERNVHAFVTGEQNPVMHSLLREHVCSAANNSSVLLLGTKQAVLPMPGGPIEPVKHAPQVLDTALQGSRCRAKQIEAGASEQSTALTAFFIRLKATNKSDGATELNKDVS